jgi:hypothetical protein
MTNVNKTHPLIPVLGTALLGVMEPHYGAKSFIVRAPGGQGNCHSCGFTKRFAVGFMNSFMGSFCADFTIASATIKPAKSHFQWPILHLIQVK